MSDISFTKKMNILIIILVLFIPLQVFSQVQTGQDINGEAAGDLSGTSVSTSNDGSIIAIGAESNDGGGTSSGHVRVYKNSAGSWLQVGQDIDGEASGDRSGWSVSLNGDGSILAIGAPQNDGGGSSAGHVRIFRNNSGTWQQIGQDIEGLAGSDEFGFSVSLSDDGNTVAIGARFNDGNGGNSGHVRVFTNSADTWVQEGQDIVGETAGDHSGSSVSLNAAGNILAIGAPRNAPSINKGQVRIYENIAGNWQQKGQDIDGEGIGDNSGSSVSLSDDGFTVAIGSRFNNPPASPSMGHVRVYAFIGSSWAQAGQDIDGSQQDEYFGSVVSLSGDGAMLATTAYLNNNINGVNAGKAVIYRNNAGTWEQFGDDILGDNMEDLFGFSVSLSADANIVGIGAIGDDDNGSFSGQVSVYNVCTTLLSITSTSPTTNASNINNNQDIIINFDNAINATLFNNSNTKISGNNGKPFSFTAPSISGSSATFTQDRSYFPGEIITTTFANTNLPTGFCPIIPYTFQFTAAVSPSSPGEFAYGQKTISTVANGANDVIAADLDGDGDLDVVSSSLFDNRIAWYENDGNGIYGPQQTISAAALFAASVSAADIDNDGDLDVLSASTLDNRIAWYENDGSGNFGPQQTITTLAQGASDVSTADLDNDGDIDVLSASLSDDRIAWYENNGAGNFGPQQTITTAADGARRVAAADLDGDGDMDVLSASGLDDRIAWYENDGSGNFGTQQNISITADGAIDVVAADLDGDGDLDVLSASANDDRIAWYENDGSGNFGPQQNISITADGVSQLAAADVDGDGDLDLISATSEDDRIAYYINDGSGSFGSQITISTLADRALSVVTADLDGDGDLDVLSASANDDRIAWYENSTAFIVTANDPLSNANNVPYTKDLTISFSDRVDASLLTNTNVKIFGDQGLPFIFMPYSILGNQSSFDPNRAYFAGEKITTTITSGVSSITGNPLATPYSFQFRTAVSALSPGEFANGENLISTTATGARDAHIADIDGDGFLDIISASYSSDKIDWYKNDGARNFMPAQNITSTANGVGQITVADIDGDGDMDMLAAISIDDKITWYKNDGSGTFGPELIITTATNSPTDVEVADLDNDGDLDVLSASLIDDRIAWYKNDGLGGFGPQLIISNTADFATSVTTADINSDGYMDVISTSQGDNQVKWYLNNGDGSFGSPQIISSTGNGLKSVEAADFNNDGAMDFVSASATDGRIAWYKNDGSGNFIEATIATTESLAQGVSTGDIDGDGFLDVLTTSFANNRIAWYANDGMGGFGSRQNISTTTSGVYDIATADLDNDGDLDVVSASSTDNKIAWYENFACSSNSIVYVDENASGLNSGADWANAFTDLQNALHTAKNCAAIDTIFVAEGTYLPTTGTDRDISFELFPDVKIYGGFSPANAAVDLATRNFSTYETILSGEIGNPGILTDNARHVVFVNNIGSNVILDGFTITKGYATASSAPKNYGGGILFSGSASSASSPLFENLIIKENFASGIGGGICFDEYISTASTLAPIIKNTLFYKNKATVAGGAVAYYLENTTTSSPVFENVDFVENESTGTGSAIWQNNSVNTVMTGIYTNCKFSSNNSAADVTIRIQDQSSNGVQNTFTNCLFSDNQGRAFQIEDDFFNAGSNTLNLVNSTITENIASSGNGGAIKNIRASNINIVNSILWNNSPDELDLGIATTNISYSLIEGYDNSTNDGLDGTNPANAPQFSDAANKDYTLQPTSPVIDKGDNAANTEPLDLAGNTRITDGDGNRTATVDFGAYETAATDPCSIFTTSIVYVDENATGNDTGNNWANAVTDLQDALFLAQTCSAINTIYVAEGTYKPTPSSNREIYFDLFPGISIYGGFSPSSGATDLATRDITLYETILSGEIGDQGIVTDNSFHVIQAENVGSNLILDGFTITKAYTTSLTFPKGRGGGILIYATGTGTSSPTLNNLRITENFAQHGGGIYVAITDNAEASPTIKNSSIENNAAQQLGGGIGYLNNSSNISTINHSNLMVTENTASFSSAVNLSSVATGSIELKYTDCKFFNNVAQSGETIGFSNSGGTVTASLTNSLIHNNTGKAIRVTSGVGQTLTLNVINTTIADNTKLRDDGAAITNRGTNTLNVANSIFWNNDTQELDQEDAAADISYSLIKGYDNSTNNGLDGTNAANNPQFTDALFPDYTLKAISPVIDKGNNALITAALDLAGNTRITDGDGDGTATVDFGAYETAAGIVLPLQLLSFSGYTSSDNFNSLNWVTASEINTSQFYIETSTNGNDYIQIATRSAVGQGDNKYFFTDSRQLPGKNYYRLKMVDKDGRFEYSKVIVLNNSDLKPEFTSYPNPAKNYIYLESKDAVSTEQTAFIFDISGKLVMSARLVGSVNRIDVRKLAAGSYIIKTENGGVAKFVKE